MNPTEQVTAAAELRAATDRIRETAGKAAGGQWRNRNGQIEGNGTRVATAAIAAGHDSADHIAMWHPGLALVIAGWLRAVAIDCESDDETYHHIKERTTALRVARLINGGA